MAVLIYIVDEIFPVSGNRVVYETRYICCHHECGDAMRKQMSIVWLGARPPPSGGMHYRLYVMR